ncbi:TPA: 4-phosphopantetheinyl transferase, partial [Aeromonas hydrophila]|nr:4-phosphopantetheinyl transferase [Aeromonas hydrophila]
MISVDLYLLKPANTDADQLSLLQTLLSPEERQTWQSIGQLARRQEYLLSRG